jgi:hypothetical protein
LEVIGYTAAREVVTMTTGAIVVCSLILVLTGTASAGPVTLQAQSLLTIPGAIAVDEQNVTAVQFCEPIGWLAYKASWLHAQISQQDRRVLLLDVSAGSGRTSAAVWIEGQGAPLQLQIRASGTLVPNHLYFVACTAQPEKPAAQIPRLQPATARRPSGNSNDSAEPAVGARPTASSDVAKTTWDTFLFGLSPHQWDLLRDLMGAPTKGAYFAFTASLSPEQAVSWATLYAGPPTLR